MKYFMQFSIVLVINYIGIIINKIWIPTIPSTVIGMVILFILLYIKVVKIENIKEFSEFMLANLAFFFIPPSISLINSWDILSGNFLKIILVVVTSTFITMIVTGLTVDYLIKRGDKNERTPK